MRAVNRLVVAIVVGTVLFAQGTSARAIQVPPTGNRPAQGPATKPANAQPKSPALTNADVVRAWFFRRSDLANWIESRTERLS